MPNGESALLLYTSKSLETVNNIVFQGETSVLTASFSDHCFLSLCKLYIAVIHCLIIFHPEK